MDYEIKDTGITFQDGESSITIDMETLKKALAEAEAKVERNAILKNAPVIDGVKWVMSDKGRPGIKSPYNPAFVSAMKAKVPSARWSADSQTWFFDKEGCEQVFTLAQEYYGEEQVRERLTFELSGYEGLKVDGKDLINFGRDSWGWHRRNCETVVVVDDSGISSGGSVRYPTLTGRCVIEITHRKNAQFEPAPVERVAVEMA